MSGMDERDMAELKRKLKLLALTYGAALMVGLAIRDLIKWGRRLYRATIELEAER